MAAERKCYVKAQVFRMFCEQCGIGTAHDSYGCINCDLLREIKSDTGPNGAHPVRLGEGIEHKAKAKG